MSRDVDMLEKLLATDGLGDEEGAVFEDMLGRLRRRGDDAELTGKQRQWVRDVFVRLGLDAGEVLNLWSEGKVPMGKPVEAAPVLRVLPKRPPGRRAS